MSVHWLNKPCGQSAKDAIVARKPFVNKDHDLQGYRTKGGTYVLATCGIWSDSGSARDLLVLPFGQALRSVNIAVNPEFVNAVRAALKEE